LTEVVFIVPVADIKNYKCAHENLRRRYVNI